MVNPWFKFYGGEYLCDTKILQLNGNERSCWITILCLASQTKDGTIKYISEKQILVMSGVYENIEILKKFEELGLVTFCNGIVTVINWEKRQLSQAYLRVKKYRNKSDNKMITEEENRIEEKRIDKEEMLPDWLNKNAWEAWKKYRKEIKKKLTPYTIKMQLKFLADYKADHTQIIKNSITNGWTGLFALKEKTDRLKQSRDRYRNNEDDAERQMTKEENERGRMLQEQVGLLAKKMSTT